MYRLIGNGCDIHDVWSAEIPEQLARGLVSSHFFGVLDSSELRSDHLQTCVEFFVSFSLFALS